MLVVSLGTVFLFINLGVLVSGERNVEYQDGDVKLMDGSSDIEGTVLVFRTYGWGAICDDNWTMKEANLVCKQLGMGYALKALRRNFYRSRSLPPYLMDEVSCRGNETRISQCRFAGWGRHDCERDSEAVGVQCIQRAPIFRHPPWNLLGLPLNRSEITPMREQTFTVRLQRQEANGTSLLIANINGTDGAICSDNFLSPEANVVCQFLGRGYGEVITEVDIDEEIFPQKAIIVHVGRCYGNETLLTDCLSYASLDGVPCKRGKAVAVKCTDVLPDILADAMEMERTSYLQRLALWHLECSLSEKCLPEKVYSIIERHPNSYSWMQRSLLRFSSIIENIGTTDFLPLEKSENWEWHACHMHYHSMKVFARYEVMDFEERKVASGQKASFCLEDNNCASGVTKKFECSNVRSRTGTQGISPGCKDLYIHDYDCQWIDVTDLRPGRYTFQVIINPDFLVPELNFFNNAIVCTMFYSGHNAVLRTCRVKHPYDLI